MDYVLDLYRMKVVSAINNDKKTHWKQFAILALLSNHAKLQELFLAFLTSLLSLDRYVKLFRAKLLREKKPKDSLGYHTFPPRLVVTMMF